jgi:ArsR family transcriptional regulator
MDPATKRLYEMKAEMIQAVGHPIRLAIVEHLRNGEQCVCDIAAHVGAKRPNVSRHLAVMLKAGVVDSRKDGLRALYSLRTPCILAFLACVSDALRERVALDRAALSAR